MTGSPSSQIPRLHVMLFNPQHGERVHADVVQDGNSPQHATTAPDLATHDGRAVLQSDLTQTLTMLRTEYHHAVKNTIHAAFTDWEREYGDLPPLIPASPKLHKGCPCCPQHHVHTPFKAWYVAVGRTVGVTDRVEEARRSCDRVSNGLYKGAVDVETARRLFLEALRDGLVRVVLDA